MEDMTIEEQDQSWHTESDWSYHQFDQQEIDMLENYGLPAVYSFHSSTSHEWIKEQSSCRPVENSRPQQNGHKMLHIYPPYPSCGGHYSNAHEEQQNLDTPAQEATTHDPDFEELDPTSTPTEYSIELDFNIEAHAIEEHVLYAIECSRAAMEPALSLRPFEQAIRDAREDLQDYSPQSYQCLLKLQTNLFAIAAKRFREGAPPYTAEEMRKLEGNEGSESLDAETEKRYIGLLEAKLALFKPQEQKKRPDSRSRPSGLPPPHDRVRVLARGDVDVHDHMDVD
jgi:hypothetical protein